MNCPRTDEIIKYLDGELSVNRHRDLGEHLRQCSVCSAQRAEIERLVERIRPDEGEFEDPALVDEIMGRVSEASVEPEPKRRWSFGLRIAVPSLAAVAAVLAVVFFVLLRGGPGADDQQFLTRGGSAAKPDRWVSLLVYQKRDATAPYRKVKRDLDADASLVFGYRNTRGTYRYLMVFAFDEAGRVFWYYPAYETAATDPASIRIEPGRHELPDEVQHRLKAGPIRVMGLFSGRPLRVSVVERTVKRAVQSKRPLDEITRLPLPDTGQASHLFQVVPGEQR